jgi:Ni/Fe-hydrogenase subunit HybB-like protein
MTEKAFSGTKKYYGWVFLLLLLIVIGFIAYLRQFTEGLGITGLSRDISWGLYIAQFTFLVGVAASAVMVVLPYYLHDFKAFGRITVLGEFLAISAVILCMLFIVVDMGQPQRVLNVALHPTPNSLMFWDMVSLGGYLLLNIIITYVSLNAEKKNMPPPGWLKPIIYLSIPWAVSIHTVTAFLYCGLSARPFWLTAILAPRFLASAFSAGPAILIILCLIIRKISKFDPGDTAIKKLAEIVTYAMAVNLFFVLLELFTSLYGGIPHHVEQFKYLYFGLEDKGALVPFAWISVVLTVSATVLLLFPSLRTNLKVLPWLCVLGVIGLWIDKGINLIITGFTPNPLGHVVEYAPTIPEVLITIGVYAVGILVLTVLYKIAIAFREQNPAGVH